MTDFLIGLDPGQRNDPCALVVAERTRLVLEHKPVIPGSSATTETINSYHVRWIERFPLGTSYPRVCTRTKDIMTSPQLRGNTTLVVDATGVGRPVIDIFDEQQTFPIAITITRSGTQVQKHGYAEWSVPKRDLVTTLQVLLQAGRIKIASALPLASILTAELTSFKTTIAKDGGQDTYGAWRERDHDDIVLATAIMAWYGEQVEPPTERQAPRRNVPAWEQERAQTWRRR